MPNGRMSIYKIGNNFLMDLKNSKIAVIGLGYVGLPLLIQTSNKYDCVGYDINIDRS